MSNSRQPTTLSNQGTRQVERRVVNQTYSYNPLVDPPGYGGNTQTVNQNSTQLSQMPQQQYMMPDMMRQQYQPADRNYFEQNLLSINDQMSNINTYNQQAVNHNQMLLEMQENKLNSLMGEVKKLKDGGNQGGAQNGKGMTKERDLENLMMLNAFDDSLANTRLYYGDRVYNQYGRYGKMGNPLNGGGLGGLGGGGVDSLFNRNSQPNLNSRRNYGGEPPLHPEQKYRKQVFGGFGELFWDDKNNQQIYQQQQQQYPNNMYNNNPLTQSQYLGQQYQNNPISAPTQQYYSQPPPQPQPQQQYYQQQPSSVFQRNSSQILNRGGNPYQQQIPASPQIPQKQVYKGSAYDMPSSNAQRQTPMKSTAYSMSALDNQPPNEDPLVNMLIKQGQLMESLSTNIEKETKKQDKNDLKKLKKKLDEYEEKQKQLVLMDEYNSQYQHKGQSIPPYGFNKNQQPKNPFSTDFLNPYSNSSSNYPSQNFYQDPYANSLSMPLQLMLALTKQNNDQQSKQSRLDQIKMSMLMRKLAIENELLKGGKAGKKSSKKSKKKGRSKKSKKKNRKSIDDGGDDDEDDDDYDDYDDWDDDDDDDWDSDEDYDDYDDEEEQEQAPPPPPQETEEEKKKREEEELKKQKEKRKLELFKRARLVKTRAVFVLMYFNTIKQQIENKKVAAYKKMNEDIASLFDFTTQWVQKVSSRGLNLIQDVKASCDITKKLSEKEMRKRVDNLKLRVKALLDGLADNCKEEDIGNVAIQIFGQYTSNFNFPPQQFLYKFEINRLKYTYFGALNDMNGRQQLMLLLMFIVIRVLILRILFKPWQYSDKIKDSPDLKLNLKVIQSVIYEILIEFLRTSCPPIQNNQAMLSSEKKIKEIPKIPAATNDPVDPIVYKDAQKNDEPVILGLFQRNQLDPIFDGVDNATWLETIKSTLQGLGESLVQTVNKKYEEFKAKQKAENIANKKNNISSQLEQNWQDKEFLKNLKKSQEQNQ